MAKTSRRKFLRTAGAAAVVPPAGAQGQSIYRAPRQRLPVLGEWDVVVAGGGSAGCSAAVAAGRLGARTLLIEQCGFLGGSVVTAGDCAVASTNGVDFQGVWHELVRLLKRRLGVAEMVRSPSERCPEFQWYRTSFDPEMVKWAWDTLLDEVQVEILHYSTVDGAIVEDGEIRGVMAYTRGGR
ncbi:MAG: FAD-dependent oxidoreductase, partial [bacterium]|nr:FAD-dependent oxidoreductase [bacterium]